MSARLDNVIEEIKAKAADHLDGLDDLLNDELKPRAVELMQESAIVAVRAAAGEDVTTARIAIESSTRNLARHAKAELQLRARDLAITSLIAAVSAAA